MFKYTLDSVVLVPPQIPGELDAFFFGRYLCCTVSRLPRSILPFASSIASVIWMKQGVVLSFTAIHIVISLLVAASRNVTLLEAVEA